ncbi:MAG: tRNA (adenosine(37)-N6)-dimethylallyltransferase MiaA [Candidatus Puniceispirillum sp.]|nr:tRNA (adenosine(37)-N6)-dimethylallyltransferase MiaA [Candidatus Pelagibacter sp.]MBA4283468.1 tRNA (adenosine(37)-N6)-dimethylallyltransferase MiaA [Candidatus Puniceispirillum sp.]
MKPLNVISIFGPTASGKTKCAIEIARQLNGSVVNFDSLQWYQGLPLLSAKPSESELKQAPHYLYDHRSYDHKGSVADWLLDVEQCIDQNRLDDGWIIMVGGTGFWLNCFLHGLSSIPLMTDQTVLKVDNIFNNLEFQDFKNHVFQIDPLLIEHNPPQDPQRLKRALAIKLQTGLSIREYQGNRAQKFNFNSIISCVLNPDKEVLERKIIHRINIMIEQNVIQEAADFEKNVPNIRCPTKHALGYWSILDYLQNKISLDVLKEQITIETRQYAKRQRTWLKSKFPNALDLSQDLNYLWEQIRLFNH